MKILKNNCLKQYNTFGVKCKADFFVEVYSLNDIEKLYAKKEFESIPKLILGGGSNILLYEVFNGLVIKMSLSGINDCGNGIIKVAAGEKWHDFVLWTIDNGYNGLENLSLIPGSTGAAPMQNIGAYGVEIQDCFLELEAFHIYNNELLTFSKQDCHFGYRESIFKRSEKDNYIIISVTFQLKNDGLLNLEYGAINEVLAKRCISSPTPKDVSDAVISIRKSKLPDPIKIGNSGSFFKNPVISMTLFNSIKERWYDIPSYPAKHDFVKVPAGWLIEKAGWKGRRFSECGVHDNQALVLVNHGSATGQEIYKLAKMIQFSIFELFEINLQIEVNIIGKPSESN
jgi:UDP-N-acetylmuramate dehydrogenase